MDDAGKLKAVDAFKCKCGVSHEEIIVVAKTKADATKKLKNAGWVETEVRGWVSKLYAKSKTVTGEKR